MSALQFSLFFAAVVVAYVLVHLRLVRFEGWLRQIGELRSLNERLDGVVRSMERVRLDRIETGLGQLHDDADGNREELRQVAALLRAQLAVLEQIVGAKFPSTAAPVVAAAPDSDAASRIRAVVEARLLDLGYRDLRILSDLVGVGLAERTEVRVEATRHHMPQKGIVAVRNGAVVDVSLQSAAKSFP
jgi:hypothetical protein